MQKLDRDVKGLNNSCRQIYSSDLIACPGELVPHKWYYVCNTCGVIQKPIHKLGIKTRYSFR